MEQMSFAAPVYRNKGKKTKRETFLAEMDKIVKSEVAKWAKVVKFAGAKVDN